MDKLERVIEGLECHLEGCFCGRCPYNAGEDSDITCDCKYDMMVDALTLLKAQQTVDGWISVKDRLPVEEDYRQCHENWDGAVIWTNGSDIGLGWYYTSTGNWADIYDCNIDDVTHWMPLPEPPKEVVKHAEQ